MERHRDRRRPDTADRRRAQEEPARNLHQRHQLVEGAWTMTSVVRGAARVNLESAPFRTASLNRAGFVGGWLGRITLPF